jgi:hypothetical protein
MSDADGDQAYRPVFSNDRTLYSWIGRSSVTGAASRVASTRFRVEPMNVPTISRTVPRASRRRSACAAGALARAEANRSGSISVDPPFAPRSTRSALAPDSRTACGKTSTNARTIANVAAGGT